MKATEIVQPPEDERHDNRGRSARQDDPDVTASRSALVSLMPYLLVALFGAGGGGGVVASLHRPDEGKLDQVLAAQLRIENRLTTLEAQGTSSALEKLESRVRRAEEELAALHALQGRGK